MKNSVQAYGKNYFKTPGCPIAVQMICSDVREQHEFDFTSIGHYHDFSEIVLVVSGHGVQYIDGQEFPVQSGDVFLLNGYTVHYFTKRENLVLYNLQFNAEELPLPECYLRKLPGYNLFFLLEPKLRRSFRKMFHTSDEECRILADEMCKLREIITAEQQGFEALAFSLLLNIIIRLARFFPVQPEEEESTLSRMGKVISLMENNFSRQWTLTELAQFACMSKNHFLRIFHEATGYSPIAYLQQLRLRRAAELLVKSDLSVGMIAAECGFYDSNYFCKLFRRSFHTSPRQYRITRLG